MKAPRTIPLVRQTGARDSGAAAVAMVLGYFGIDAPLGELNRRLLAVRQASSPAELLDLAAAYGLRGRTVRVRIEELDQVPPATILAWEPHHFVVLQRVGRNGVDLIDPAAGPRSVPLDAFVRLFTGQAIVFEPTDAPEQDVPRSKRKLAILRKVIDHQSAIVRLVAISLLVQLLSATLPLLTAVLIDRVIPRKDHTLLWLLAAGYCGLQVFNTVSGFVREYLAVHFRAQLEAEFTLRFFDHLINLPYTFFRQRTSGDLMMRLGANTAVRDIVTSALLSVLLDGLMASMYLVFLLLFSTPLTLVVMLLAGARLVVLALMRRKQRRLLNAGLDNLAKSQTAQVEILTAIETLKGMGLEQRAAADWTNLFIDGVNISAKKGRLDARFNIVLGLLGLVSTLLLTFYGAYLVIEDVWTLGSMIAFGALAGGFLGPLNKLLTSALQLQVLEVYLEYLNDVWDTPQEQRRGAFIPCAPMTGAFELERVCFKYAEAAPLVLRDISMVVPAGSRVAIVGRTGSGKSTLVRLIAALYEPSAGKVLVDRRDLSTLDRRWVRRQLGIVTQDSQLFGGSVRRNIALTNPDMPFDAVVSAAKLACLHDEILAMPRGYDTPLASRGLSISGGQAQRLALARALASKPRILILDEATSQLDAVTEDRVKQNLGGLRCTMITIAHRLSTIKDADIIFVLSEGGISQAGRHDELLAASSEYAELVSVHAASRTASTAEQLCKSPSA